MPHPSPAFFRSNHEPTNITPRPLPPNINPPKGCDAPEPSRKYYTEVVKGLPKDTVVLTLVRLTAFDRDLTARWGGLTAGC